MNGGDAMQLTYTIFRIVVNDRVHDGDFDAVVREVLNYPYGRYYVMCNNLRPGPPKDEFDAEGNRIVEVLVEDHYAQMSKDRLQSGLLHATKVGTANLQWAVAAEPV